MQHSTAPSRRHRPKAVLGNRTERNPGPRRGRSFRRVRFGRQGSRRRAMTAAAKQSAILDEVEVERRLEAGLAHHAAGDIPAAIARFEQALALDPDNATGLYLLGLARFGLGEADEAQRLLERLVAVRGHRAEAHLALASIRHWREDRVGAIAAYRAALDIDPLNLAALVG